MPPKQCPACGRFLKNAFVEALQDAPAGCPGCEDELTAAMFHEVELDEVESDGAELGEVEDASVRPPDLDTQDVRDPADDVLAGWDVGADAAEIASWRHDERPFPTDTVVVAGAGAVGLVLGAAGSQRRVLGASLGMVGGVLAAAVFRQVWRLQP